MFVLPFPVRKALDDWAHRLRPCGFRQRCRGLPPRATDGDEPQFNRHVTRSRYAAASLRCGNNKEAIRHGQRASGFRQSRDGPAGADGRKSPSAGKRADGRRD